MPCPVSSYSYPALSQGENSIRLLRLLPHEDSNAHIECQLFEVLLSHLQGRAYLYEALSYVWGGIENLRTISVCGYNFLVRNQLYEALLRLRNRHFERVMWVDAICINQENEREKEQQIRLMPMIYNQAYSVMVWLGEEADQSDQALEAILCAGWSRKTSMTLKATIGKAVINLLQRRWFRRIWILQEAAAARHIRLRCGNVEIDGHAFCLGVNALRRYYEADTDLENRLRSITYLMRGAIFRPDQSRLDIAQDSICPLGELIDMYHGHEAGILHDKIYALLGMSSDGSREASLVPDYQKQWEDALESLTKFIIGKKISTETRPGKAATILRSKGRILGTITSVDRDRSWDDRQNLSVRWGEIIMRYAKMEGLNSPWIVQDSAKTIQKGDLVCHLEGAARLTVIRRHEDFSAILIIAAQHPDFLRTIGEPPKSLDDLLQIGIPMRELTLVWDWNDTLEKRDAPGQLEDWMKDINWEMGVQKQELRGPLWKAKRYWNFGLISGDFKRYQEAEIMFEQAMVSYEMALMDNTSIGEIEEFISEIRNSILFKGEKDQYLIHREKGWTPLCCAVREEHERLVKLLLETGEVDVNVRDNQKSTLLSLAAGRGSYDIVELLLKGKAEVNTAPGSDKGRTALQAAAGGGHLAIVERLLEEKAEVNAAPVENNGKTALQAAAEGGHLAVVERLLKEKADVNAAAAVGWNGRTALQAAAGGGHLAVVERLLEEKADVNAITAMYGGLTALQAAAKGGHVAIVERLLEEGAEVNAAPGKTKGKTALQAAAGGGHLVVVECLLERKAEVNAAPEESDGITALQAAAQGGHFAIVARLLEEGAEVNAAAGGDEGRTALQAAAGGGHLAVFERLLEENADVNAAMGSWSDGRTALQAAAEGGHLAIVERLLEEGAEVNAAPGENKGRTALQAAAGGGHLAVVERLLEENANVNAAMGSWSGGRTALQAAAEGGHLAIVVRLLEEGAEVNAAPGEDDGKTALQAAAGGGHLAVVERLLEEKTEVNAAPARWRGGRTALQAAAEGGHLAVVVRLLEEGAEVNAVSGENGGKTALQAAAEGGHLAIVERLLEEKAEVDAAPTGQRRKTALGAAAESGHHEIVDLLRLAGASKWETEISWEDEIQWEYNSP